MHLAAAILSLHAAVAGAGGDVATAQQPDDLGASGRIFVGVPRLLPLAGIVGSSPATLEVGDSLDRAGAATPRRVSFDWTVATPLTLGADALFALDTAASTARAERTSTVGLSPRLGLMRPLVRSVALWPRVGTTLTESWSVGAGGRSPHFETALATELLVAVCPLPHLVVTAGPFLDVPLERAPVSLVVAGGLHATF
jgi:hypothetical protein